MRTTHDTREATDAPSAPRRGSDPVAGPPAVARLLALQRSAGNAAVNRLLRIPLISRE